jgi:hypothetical protein
MVVIPMPKRGVLQSREEYTPSARQALDPLRQAQGRLSLRLKNGFAQDDSVDNSRLRHFVSNNEEIRQSRSSK